jgi:predicted enzyme related to lactoylglutathione lyase
VITKARTVGIHVSDQQRALEFYRDRLGFELIQDAPMGDGSGARWLVVAPPGAETQFVLFTPPGSESRIGGFVNLVFQCDDIHRTHEELSARGVEFTQPPVQQFWGWWAQFTDPDGNEFGLSVPD